VNKIQAAEKGDPGVTRIRLDADSPGREYEGWGVLSAGATSVFLRDYPEPYRSDILDYLFKPKFGLNIQHLKVEIGSAMDSTCGAEPSHVITPEELKNPIPRGYEFWLAAEARKRNPKIMLDALPWGTPYWTKDFTTKEAADWVVAFLDCAKKHYGLDFQYVGGVQNELLSMIGGGKSPDQKKLDRPFTFIKEHLRPALDKAGYKDVQIEAADYYNKRHKGKYKWSVIKRVMADPELDKAMDVVGYHYPVGYLSRYADDRPLPKGFLESGKRLWASEDYSVRGGSFDSAHIYMGKIIREYDELRITKSIAWAPFTSIPKGFLWDNVGFLDASDCWNGHYKVWPGLWSMAQLTQFVEPGWKFMDSAVGSIGKGKESGKYCAFKAPNGKDWSLIVVTGAKPTPVRIEIDNKLGQKQIHAWKSDIQEQMQKLQPVSADNGVVTLKLDGKSIYTLTTTTGQTKGKPAHPIPPEVAGGPRRDDFSEGYKLHDSPRYWGALEGTFEIAEHEGRQVLKQVVPKAGCKWHKGLHGGAILLFGGADHMKTFSIRTETMIQAGFVELGGAVIKKPLLKFQLKRTGDWTFFFEPITKSGTIENFDGDAWHTMETKLVKKNDNGYVVSCAVDGKDVFNSPVDEKLIKAVTPCITSSYAPNMFKSIEVVPGL
jgi:galactosylceramidase